MDTFLGSLSLVGPDKCPKSDCTQAASSLESQQAGGKYALGNTGGVPSPMPGTSMGTLSPPLNWGPQHHTWEGLTQGSAFLGPTQCGTPALAAQRICLVSAVSVVCDFKIFL